MPQNRYVVRVDPQGQAMVVDILDTSGASVPAYDSSQFAAALRTLPLSIDSPTEFWVAAGSYDVSAKVNGAEIASGAGTPVRVTVSDDPVTVRPVVSASELPAVVGPTGGSSPVTREWFNSRDFLETVNSGSFHQLSWVPFPAGSGDDLFDVTDPLNPVPHVAGIYAVTINVCLNGGTKAPPASGMYDLFVELDMDANGLDGTASAIFPINCVSGISWTQGSVSVTQYLPANGVVNAYMRHSTGQAQDFFLEAIVQRVT